MDDCKTGAYLRSRSMRGRWRGVLWVPLVTALFLSLLGDRGWADSVSAPPAPPSERADPARRLFFPQDHGAHPLFETEWWYVTGHLVPKGAPLFGSPSLFGVQLTFFRRRKGDGTWGQAYAAHGALGEMVTPAFTHDVRYGRSGLGLASVSERALQVNLMDWGLETIGDRWLLRWNLPGERAIRLITEPITHDRIVRQGVNGFSQKASCAQCASMYYSVPWLRAEGEVRIAGSVQSVDGILWMDHEFMTNALQTDQVGWDWFSVMTEQGLSLMLFRVRGKEPGHDYFSGSVHSNGRTTTLKAGDFTITTSSSWTSPTSGTTYPQEWHLQVPSIGFDEVLRALLPDQELRTAGKPPIAYWEGAVANARNTVKGYAELTGYGEPVAPGL